MTAVTVNETKTGTETVAPGLVSVHEGDTLEIDGKRIVVASEPVATVDHLNRAVWRFERTGPGDRQWGVIDVLATSVVTVLARGCRP